MILKDFQTEEKSFRFSFRCPRMLWLSNTRVDFSTKDSDHTLFLFFLFFFFFFRSLLTSYSVRDLLKHVMFRCSCLRCCKSPHGPRNVTGVWLLLASSTSRTFCFLDLSLMIQAALPLTSWKRVKFVELPPTFSVKVVFECKKNNNNWSIRILAH